MNHKRRLTTLTTAGSLAALFVLSFPAPALADGYYHYTAPDMNTNQGDWSSNYKVKRMNWHPWTTSGTVASVQSTLAPWLFGQQKHWHWFQMFRSTNGDFYGHKFYMVNGVEYKETLRVKRFYSPWPYAPGVPTNGNPNAYAWTNRALVTYCVYKKGNPNPVDWQVLVMEYRDQRWW